MDVGAEPWRPAVSAASQAVTALRSATDVVVNSYLSIAEGYAVVVGELTREREARRAAEREAEMLGGKLAEAHELIRRLQSAAPAFAELERTMLAELENTERAEVLAAFEAGPKATTEDPFPWSRVKLGLCPGCNKLVYSGQKFNMHRLSWGADFAGDVPGERLVFTHRACGGGDHSKDGV